MHNIWKLYEELDEFVYATDMDTYDLVYMNKKARETFGFSTMQELKGKKCYEVLQHCSVPCSICSNAELAPGRFKRWRYYNPILATKIGSEVVYLDKQVFNAS